MLWQTDRFQRSVHSKSLDSGDRKANWRNISLTLFDPDGLVGRFSVSVTAWLQHLRRFIMLVTHGNLSFKQLGVVVGGCRSAVAPSAWNGTDLRAFVGR
jgi:hypothetical protein